MDSNEKRHELFVQLFNQTVSHKQILAVASLLEIWPALEGDHDGENVWYLVLSKLIAHTQDGVSVIKLMRGKVDTMFLDKKVWCILFCHGHCLLVK